jgi:hypothetical protein
MSRTKSFFRNALPWTFTLALIMVAIPLWANPSSNATTPPATASPAKNKTEVIADEASKTVRIVVDGKDVAVFDSKGLRVDGNIGLTGTFRPAIISGPAPLGPSREGANSEEAVPASSPARNP